MPEYEVDLVGHVRVRIEQNDGFRVRINIGSTMYVEEYDVPDEWYSLDVDMTVIRNVIIDAKDDVDAEKKAEDARVSFEKSLLDADAVSDLGDAKIIDAQVDILDVRPR